MPTEDEYFKLGSQSTTSRSESFNREKEEASTSNQQSIPRQIDYSKFVQSVNKTIRKFDIDKCDAPLDAIKIVKDHNNSVLPIHKLTAYVDFEKYKNHWAQKELEKLPEASRKKYHEIHQAMRYKIYLQNTLDYGLTNQFSFVCSPFSYDMIMDKRFVKMKSECIKFIESMHFYFQNGEKKFNLKFSTEIKKWTLVSLTLHYTERSKAPRLIRHHLTKEVKIIKFYPAPDVEYDDDEDLEYLQNNIGTLSLNPEIPEVDDINKNVKTYFIIELNNKLPIKKLKKPENEEIDSFEGQVLSIISNF
ncbi:hypothetical protein KGF54_000270 [Candida jiufengensis]|uniref:uncharacterized protein n=1 Tax=Candida jiufengensis TaxID=497108 RepID=UPI0022250CB8|nr:uncharacterized protein KGF54_000270 [Candida jiufengensis]KAI5957342.1 hypothetical protein KGF54_000270 [Candida jiufengensis]